MCAAKQRHCAVVFLMMFALGLSLGLIAEDVLEVAYDESEAVPYETTPSFSIVSRSVSPWTPQVMPKSDSLRKRCEGHAEDRAWSVRSICDSFNILDHSFRC